MRFEGALAHDRVSDNNCDWECETALALDVVGNIYLLTYKSTQLNILFIHRLQ